jgi:hypothetical protein
MFFWNLSTRQASPGKPPRKQATRPLTLEALESRTLLSVFTVDRLTDSSSGQGSGQAGDLRYCILSAVHDGDAITFGVMGIIQLSAALPDIIHGINIAGPGADLVTVSGNHLFRVFNIAAEVDVTISGLTIASGQVGTGVNGAGIDNAGTLTVVDCVFSGNSTPAVVGGGSGGGIYNAGTLAVTGSTFSGNVAASGGGISNRGTVTVADSTFSNNSAIAGGGVFNGTNRATVINSVFRGNSAHGSGGLGGGAGLWNFGTLTVASSTFSGNATDAGGGGGGILSSSPGFLTVSNSTFSGNSASTLGGGLYNSSTLTVSNSTFSGNSASGGGGLYNNSAALTITNSTFGDNLATSDVGGGIYNNGRDMATVTHSALTGNSAGNSSGGGVANRDGTVTITDSTLSDNFARFNGGGLWNSFGVLTVTNSTLSNNSSNGSGGGIANGDPSSSVTVTNSTLSNNSAAMGGAIDNAGGSKVTVSNSTLSNNSAASGGAINNRDLGTLTGGTVTVTSSTVSGNSATQTCGGLDEASSGSTMVRNSIVAANAAPASPDVCGPLNSQGSNLIGDGTGGRGYTDSDLVGTSDDPIDPRLGPLQDNGGPNQTRALLPYSPALNAGDLGLLGTPDQRGVRRSGGVNIGAFQASASAFLLSAPAKVTVGAAFHLTVTAVDPFGQVAVGYTGTVTFRTTDPNPAVVLPADYTFTAADAGVHSFRAIRLVTRGRQAIVVTDTADAAVTGSTTTKVRYLHHHDGGSRVGSDVAVAAADRFFATLAEDVLQFAVASQRPQSGFGRR